MKVRVLIRARSARDLRFRLRSQASLLNSPACPHSPYRANNESCTTVTEAHKTRWIFDDPGRGNVAYEKHFLRKTKLPIAVPSALNRDIWYEPLPPQQVRDSLLNRH